MHSGANMLNAGELPCSVKDGKFYVASVTSQFCSHSVCIEPPLRFRFQEAQEHSAMALNSPWSLGGRAHSRKGHLRSHLQRGRLSMSTAASPTGSDDERQEGRPEHPGCTACRRPRLGAPHVTPAHTHAHTHTWLGATRPLGSQSHDDPAAPGASFPEPNTDVPSACSP